VHTVAAYFPEQPSAAEQQAALGLVSALALLYPCRHCREAFAGAAAEEPPDVSSRAGLSAWACRQHNRVNAALGKQAFPCEQEALQQRWRTGRQQCWGLLQEQGEQQQAEAEAEQAQTGQQQ
jgi:FAD-linked sulfhydryl oxidase